MKQIFYLFVPIAIGIALFASCKNGATTADTKKDSVAMPYKASYSSSFAISDTTKNVLAVLQSYKDWEDNKLDNGPAYYADTVSIDFSDGNKFKARRDSLIKIGHKYRDSLSNVKIDMVSIVSLHSIDKNADWVSVWYKETDTRKTGKIDSSFYNDVNHLKNGKIDYVTSFRQALKKSK